MGRRTSLIGCVLLLGRCASAGGPRAPVTVPPSEPAPAVIEVRVSPTGPSIERYDSAGVQIPTHVFIAGAPDRGYAIAIAECGTDVLLVQYEVKAERLRLVVRRSTLGRVLWTREIDGGCATFDGDGNPLAGRCTALLAPDTVEPCTDC